MPIDAAVLQARIEVEGAAQAQRELQGFGAQIDRAGQSAQRSTGQHTAMGRAVQGAGQQVQSAGRNAQQAQGAFTTLGGAFQNVNARSIAATAGVAGIGLMAANAGRQAIRAGIDYESAFAGVRKTVDATEAEFASLDRGIRNMAMTIPVAATEIAGVAEAAGQLGVQTSNVLEFTRTMTDLGVATNMSAEQAASALARMANITGMAQSDFDKLGSTIVELGNNLATTESEITDMALRISGAGAQIGLTEAEILSFAGALSSVGIEAQAGGTAISRVMIDMANAVASGSEELAIFAEVAGMTSSQFQAAFREDAAGAVITFVEGLDRISMSGGNVFATLEELGLAEVRVRDALLRASGAGDLFRESIERGSRAWQENTALTREAELRYETTASQLQILKNQANEAAIAGFEILGPAIRESASMLGEFIVSIPPAVQGIADFVTEVQELRDADPSEREGLTGFLADVIELGSEAVDVLNAVNEAASGGSGGKSAAEQRADDMIAALEEILNVSINTFGDSEQALYDWQASLGISFTNADAIYQHYIGTTKEVYEANKEMMAGLQEGLREGGPGRMSGLDDLSLDLLALRSNYVDTGRVIREEMQASGQGFQEFGNESELAFTRSTATFNNFATAFQGNTDMALSSLGELATAASSGAIDFSDAMSLYADIPRDVLVPAITETAAEIRGKLAQATLSDEDRRAVEGQLEALRAIFPDLIAEIDGVAGAFGNFGAIQDQFQANIAAAGEGVSEWQGHLSGAEQALKFLEEQQEKNGSLTAEQQAQYDTLTGAVERYTGGVEDNMHSLVDAEVAKAEFIATQDELNQALADGTITQKEYDEAISEAASALDPMTAGQMDLAEATLEVIDKLRDFMIELGLIEPPPPVELEVDPDDAYLTLDEYQDKYGTMPDPPPTVLSVDDADAMLSLNEFVAKQGEIDPAIDTTVTADTYNAASAIQALIDKARAGATMPVNVVMTGGGMGLTAFADGGISEGGLALVGEEGPEFVVLPKGAEVIPNPETMAMIAGMPFLGGFADGTGLELTDADRQALQILGELHVVINPQSVAEAEAELATLWDARRIAEELGLGEAVIAELDEQIQSKQGELDLVGRVAGTAFGEGVLAELEAIAESDRFTGIFRLPSTPGTYSLDDIISGDAQKKLKEDFNELWQMQRIANDLGMTEWAAEIGQQMKDLGLDEEFINSVINSETGQRLADNLEEELQAARLDERFASIFAGPGAAENLMGDIDELSRKIGLGLATGVSDSVIAGWEADKAELQEQAGFYWWDVANAAAQGLIDEDALAAFAEAGGEQFRMYLESLVGPAATEQMLDGVTELGEASIGQLAAMFAETPEMVGQFLDDIVMGVQDGSMQVEDAFRLLAQIPEDQMGPAIDRLETMWTVDLAQAIIDGDDAMIASLEELLAILREVEGQVASTGRTASIYENQLDYSAQRAARRNGSGGSGGYGRGSSGGFAGGFTGGSGGGFSSGVSGIARGATGRVGGTNRVPDRHLAGMGAIPRGDPRVPDDWGGGITPSGVRTPNDRGVHTYQDAIDHYLQTGDPSLMGIFAFASLSGAMGGHGGDIAGYMEGLMNERADPNYGAKAGTKFLSNISTLMQQFPELIYDERFWDGVTGSLKNASISDGKSPQDAVNAMIRLVVADIQGMTTIDPETGMLISHAIGTGPKVGKWFDGTINNHASKHLRGGSQKDEQPSSRELLLERAEQDPFIVGDRWQKNRGIGKLISYDEWRKYRERQYEIRRQATPLATGGVIDEPLLAIMGEAGREAVLPLEGRGAQVVAEAIVNALGASGTGRGQTIVIDAPIILDGREIGRFSRQVMIDDYRRTL